MDSKGEANTGSIPEGDQFQPRQTSSAQPAPASTTPSTSTPASKKVVDELDPELDALLNDALEDFDKPPPVPPKNVGLDAAAVLRNINSRNAEPSQPKSKSTNQTPATDDMNSVWSEEFIREATAQFEKNMRELLGQGPSITSTSGSTTGATSSKLDASDGLHKVIEAATSAALSGSGASAAAATPDGIAASLNEAIKNIKSQTSAAEGHMPLSDDELSKLMGSIGIGMGEGEVDDADMNAFLPFMTNMMQKLLSKELLHPVLTDLVDRYPDWLADNREKISSVQYEKYNQQYEYMRRICSEYAQEKETDSDEIKSKRFDRISDLMLKVQYIGPPPSELVGEMDPNGLATLDPSMAAQCTIM